MLTQTETLTFGTKVQAEAAEVFGAFTNPSVLRNWLCDAAEVDTRKEGRIYLWWDDGYYAAGAIANLVRNESLSFTWQGKGEPSASEVRVSFAYQDGKTAVNVEQSGITSEESARKITQIWEGGLENLQSVVETGIDLRFARRPMFGLNDAGELDREKAAKLGVPVTEGVWLGGLIEGMGAHAAGLQKDDVLVGLGGKDVTNWNSFRAALEQHRAGDKVPVVFYRGPERHTVTMELSRRKITEVPASVKELADKARASYAAVDSELEECFKGVTEAEADHRPTPDDWSAKQIVAHLIAVERDVQTWIAGTIEEADMENVFQSNSKERVTAIVAVYPSIAVLLEELRREEALTVAMIATLPAKTFAHKNFIYQLADWMTNFPDHTREHIGEIKKLVETARN